MNHENQLNIDELIHFFMNKNLSPTATNSSGSLSSYEDSTPYSSDFEITKEDIRLKEKLKQLEIRQTAMASVTTDWMMDLESRMKLVEKASESLEEEKKYLRENIEILSEIGELEDNWNNYGAPKFNQSLIFKCLRIITSSNLKFQPEIFPTARQSIQFEYEPDDYHYFEIEIFIDRIKIYSRIKNDIIKMDNLTEEQAISEMNKFQLKFSSYGT